MLFGRAKGAKVAAIDGRRSFGGGKPAPD